MDKQPGRIIPIKTITRPASEMPKAPRTTFAVKLGESAPLELHAPLLHEYHKLFAEVAVVATTAKNTGLLATDPHVLAAAIRDEWADSDRQVLTFARWLVRVIEARQRTTTAADQYEALTQE